MKLRCLSQSASQGLLLFHLNLCFVAAAFIAWWFEPIRKESADGDHHPKDSETKYIMIKQSIHQQDITGYMFINPEDGWKIDRKPGFASRSKNF